MWTDFSGCELTVYEADYIVKVNIIKVLIRTRCPSGILRRTMLPTMFVFGLNLLPMQHTHTTHPEIIEVSVSHSGWLVMASPRPLFFFEKPQLSNACPPFKGSGIPPFTLCHYVSGMESSQASSEAFST